MCSLKKDSSLQNGKYVVQTIIKQDNLSITYQAIQVSMNRVVYVKEFFMQDFCHRSRHSDEIAVNEEYETQVGVFLKKFFADAKSKAKGDLGNEENVFDVFEENSTAYYVYLNESGSVQTGDTGPQGEETVIEPKPAERSFGKSVDIAGDMPAGNRQHKGRWLKKNNIVLACICFFVLGIVIASVVITQRSSYYSAVPDDIDTTYVDEDTVLVDSVVYTDDMQESGAGGTESLQDKFDEYIRLSEEAYKRSKANIHKPGNVQNILDARYYYYDKADKINVSMKGERLPANKELDDITEEEYQYWVGEAKKLGSDRTKFATKRKYLSRAKALSFKHQNQLDAQIKWLDEQLAPKSRKSGR